ncbi:MAG: response regulator [Chloroflexota bacterium]
MSEKPSILIVEDDEKIVQLIEVMLRDLGVEVHHRNNGQDALVYLENSIPNLIILDISMPVMTGWQFLELMNETPANRGIPVIVMTAHNDSVNRMTGQLQGVKAYLNKPVMPDDLRQQVSRILQLF